MFENACFYFSVLAFHRIYNGVFLHQKQIFSNTIFQVDELDIADDIVVQSLGEPPKYLLSTRVLEEY